MAASVKSVPNPYFDTKQLTSFASSIVSRRRVRFPCNQPGTYSHNAQNSLPYVMRFDISDPENFIDTDSLRLNFTMAIPDASKQATRYLMSGTLGNITYGDTGATAQYKTTTDSLSVPYQLDGGLQALLARIRICNVQGLVIEEHTMYNLWSNVLATFEPEKQDIVNETIRDFSTVNCSMELKNISIFKQMKYFPLFLFRSALRIEIEFEDPKMCLYLPERKVMDIPMPTFTTANVMSYGTPLVDKSGQFSLRKYGRLSDGTAAYRNLTPVYLAGKSATVGLYTDGTNQPTLTVWEDVGDKFQVSSANYPSQVATSKPASDVYQERAEIWYTPAAAYLNNKGDNTRLSVTLPSLTYTITNAELTLDYVKPSSDVSIAYINAYNTPSGIPYPYLRTFYHTFQTSGGSAVAPLQIQIPFSVRSLKGIFVVISDPLSSFSGNDQTWAAFPSLSSFMTRGLKEAQLVVGAQQFPAYRMQIRPDGQYLCNGHLSELETVANQLFSKGAHNIKLSDLHLKAQNYHELGLYDGSFPVTTTAATNALTLSPAGGYRDTRKFILGFSTQKFDGDFASGIDTTASGQVTLNLTFEEHALIRARQIHIFGIADAVFTLQKDASLVRY